MDKLLLLDVDGPLNPYAIQRDAQTLTSRGYEKYGLNGYPVWLNRSHGEALEWLRNDFGLTLVWATTWENDAPDMIAPRVGLPMTGIPVINFVRKFSGAYSGGHWKFDGVLEYADGRALAWFDDEFGVEFSHDLHRDEDRAWFLAERGDAPTLLHTVDPRVGLVAADFEAVATWAAGLDEREPEVSAMS